MRALRSLIAAAALLSIAPATAQQGVPYFPQTIPSGTFVGRLSSGPGPTEVISTTAMLNALFPANAAAFPFQAASVAFQGSVNGAVTVEGQAAAGNWTLLWPITVGANNNCFVESVSGSTATASWQGCALLAGNNTFSGNNTHNGAETFNGLTSFNSTFQRSGVTQNFPPSGNLVGTSDIQTLTNKSIDAGQLTGTINTARLPGSIDTNLSSSKTSNYTAVSSDCGAPILLGGNTLFTLTVNAASGYSSNCHLIIINTDVYSGVGTGRGKSMQISGITQHILYPGQKLDLRRNGTSWQPDQLLSGAYGQVWFVPSNNVQYFMDTGGSDNNDGLASGTSNAFRNIQQCINVAYNQTYMRSLQSTITCSGTAGQTQTPGALVTAFYQMPNASLTINSATPGTRWTWNCPASNACFQFGDNFLGGMTDVAMVGTASSGNLITGHQFSILDLTNMAFTGASTSTNILGCDFDTHYNVNASTTTGTMNTFIFACQGSSWQVSGVQTGTSSPAPVRYYVAQAGSKIVFQGGTSWSGWGAGGVGISTGNSVVNNVSGNTPPGGTPTTLTGGLYCTTSC